ncbi:sensor histidine kinase, partial [Noviherbaspirillum denitrificans]|uniref:histidine kinase n=1 Tax=Noviherbaspirillum denitrificans TaxID=1968433 RepID=A0A254TM37_9BURK
MVGGIAGTTDATVHLANRLLSLARAEHGAAEGELQHVSLTGLARQVGLELAVEAVKKDIDLSFEGQREVRVRGHELLLHEMLANLVDNAIRYTPAGGRLVIRVFKVDVPMLEVEDSGPGIPESERERVFAPFYRAATAQAVNAAGSGLGLTIVRDIAAMHGASVELLDGAQGAGLKVRILFPL